MGNQGMGACSSGLAKVPVSEPNVGDDKYDVIDELTGMAYEEAIAKISDAERQVYAARGQEKGENLFGRESSVKLI